MSEKERLRKVRRISELRAGLLVLLRSCGACGRAHRLVLVRLDASTRLCGPVAGPARGRCLAPGWFAIGGCAALGEGAAGLCFAHGAIPEGRLYIVETGLDADADAQAIAEDEREAARIAARAQERQGVGR